MHLVESNRKKCIFLEEAVRTTKANAIVHCCRIEDMDSLPVEAITARGLASLPRLLDYAEPFLGRGDATCLFLKGRSIEEELTDSKKKWIMEVQRFPSLSDPEGLVLLLSNISRCR